MCCNTKKRLIVIARSFFLIITHIFVHHAIQMIKPTYPIYCTLQTGKEHMKCTCKRMNRVFLDRVINIWMCVCVLRC